MSEPAYYEDVEIGDTQSFGEYEVTKEEVLEFAEKYDPQPFHVDEEAARESMFGGLIASGWHTASMTMRMFADNIVEETNSTGALGVDELRWKRPVRPGDTLRVEMEILDKEPWNDSLGIVHSGTKVFNQDDVEVMSYVGLLLFRMRDA
jgi:acyl dehydratase